MAEPTFTSVGVGARAMGKDVKLAWKALASKMIARRAYRKYHGTFRSTYPFETWGTVVLLVILWGLYAVQIGDVSEIVGPGTALSAPLLEFTTTAATVLDGSAASDEMASLAGAAPGHSSDDYGLVLTFAWVYSTLDRQWFAAAAAAAYLFVAYTLLRYQNQLQLVFSFWVTVAACVCMGWLAWGAVRRSGRGEEGKNLLERSQLVWVWIIVQLLLVLWALFQKKMIPRLNQQGKLISLKLASHQLYSGAYEGLEGVWERFPALKDRIVAEYTASGQALYSFEGKYYSGLEGLLRFVGIHRLYTAQYVGGLDSHGSPHGLGVWRDSHADGEFLVGRFVHGTAVGPFRSKTTTASGFIAHRIAVLSCRTDPVTSVGPLSAAKAAAKFTSTPPPSQRTRTSPRTPGPPPAPRRR